MNDPAVRTLPWSVAAALCAGLVLAAAGCRRTAPPAPPLAGAGSTNADLVARARSGEPAGLVLVADHQSAGRGRRDRRWQAPARAGKWRAIYFGYTFCPDVCPTDLQHLMQGYRAFAATDPAAAAKLRPIFVSVDPHRDTPPVMKAYVAAFGPGLTGLTGSDAQIAAMAKRYLVSYRRVDTPGSSQYLMDHTRQTVLFDPAGAPIALLPTDDNGRAVAAELARWVR